VDGSRFEWSDTLSLRAGASWQMTRELEASIGASWHPTPVPAQVGRTNYADNTLLGLTFGERIDFKLGRKRFIVAFALQLYRMLPRTTLKDPSQIVDDMPDAVRTLESKRAMPESEGLQTNNPGFPGYRADGWLAAGSLSIAHPF
jgi:long-chain fatty acid transport protein